MPKELHFPIFVSIAIIITIIIIIKNIQFIRGIRVMLLNWSTTMPAIARKYQNATIRVPRHTYERAKIVVEEYEEITSLNELFVEAIEEKIKEMEEAKIDAAFAEMANDPEYQRDAVNMAREFAQSDWEAFTLGQTRQDEQPKPAADESGTAEATKASSR